MSVMILIPFNSLVLFNANSGIECRASKNKSQLFWSFRTYIFSFIPLAYLFINLIFNEDIINGFSYLISQSGNIIIIYLLIILFIPIFDRSQAIINRRSLGISTFIYALIHFVIYIIDNNLELFVLSEDLLNITYIQIGYLALILFIPLVLTSNEYSKKIMKAAWMTVHKLIYLIIFMSLFHYYLVIKADYLLLNTYISLFLLILVFKYIFLYKSK